MFIVGALFYILRGGFNLGVDFKAGIALQFQIAPSSFTLQYTGPGKAEVTIPAGEQALTAAGDFIITVTAPDGAKQSTPFRYADYATVQALADAVDAVADIAVADQGRRLTRSPRAWCRSPGRPTSRASPSRSTSCPSPARACRRPWPTSARPLRRSGSSTCRPSAGRRTRSSSPAWRRRATIPEFQTRTEAAVLKLLGDKYGADQVILKRTDFVGPRLSLEPRPAVDLADRRRPRADPDLHGLPLQARLRRGRRSRTRARRGWSCWPSPPCSASRWTRARSPRS